MHLTAVVPSRGDDPQTTEEPGVVQVEQAGHHIRRVVELLGRLDGDGDVEAIKWARALRRHDDRPSNTS
jgi:hypothetical protein